jgi:hypothetical protein
LGTAGFIRAIHVLTEVELDKKTWTPANTRREEALLRFCPGMTGIERPSSAKIIQRAMLLKNAPLTCNHLVAYYQNHG